MAVMRKVYREGKERNEIHLMGVVTYTKKLMFICKTFSLSVPRIKNTLCIVSTVTDNDPLGHLSYLWWTIFCPQYSEVVDFDHLLANQYFHCY